jgi:D-alanyl-D-alanine carboxypeptidase
MVRILLISALVICFVSCSKEATYTGSINPHLENYNSILDAFTKKGHPGVGALIQTEEEGIWNGSAGFASIEKGLPISPEHLFFSSSCAKAYTATAVLMLYEEGKIELDLCIDHYLPKSISDQIPNGHTATVRQLLQHTSGIPDSDEKRPVIEIHNNIEEWYWQDDLEGVYGMNSLFAPGTSLEYRATNYILLAVIIDELTGNHGRFFSERIFKPLGLTNTYYKTEPGLPHPENLVEIYYDRYGDGIIENLTDILCVYSYNTTYGSCGLIASLGDYAAFIQALLDGKILKPETLEIMISPSFPGYEWRGMGIGIFDWIDNDAISHRYYEMAGSSVWGLTQVRYFPADGITIACATNIGTTNRPDSHQNFNELLYDLTYSVFMGRN